MVLFLAFAFWWAGRVGELSSVISSWRQGLETIFWDGKVVSSVIFVLLYWERYLNIVDVGVVTGTVVVFVLSGWNCMKLGKFGFLEEQFAWDVAVLSTDWMFEFLGCEFSALLIDLHCWFCSWKSSSCLYLRYQIDGITPIIAGFMRYAKPKYLIPTAAYLYTFKEFKGLKFLEHQISYKLNRNNYTKMGLWHLLLGCFLAFSL